MSLNLVKFHLGNHQNSGKKNVCLIWSVIMTTKIISQIPIWIQTRYIFAVKKQMWMQRDFSLKKAYLSIIHSECYMLYINTSLFIHLHLIFFSAVYCNSNSDHFHNNSRKILQWIGDEDNKKIQFSCNQFKHNWSEFQMNVRLLWIQA